MTDIALPPPDRMLDLTLTWGSDLASALLLLAAGWFVARWSERAVRRLIAPSKHVDPTLKPLLGSLVRYAILIFVVIAALAQFGVQTTSIIAVVGAAGLAIGLALQGTLANIAVAKPENLYHVVLDNGVHASTGGQRTISPEVRLEEIARTCGYADTKAVTSLEEVVPGMEWLFEGPGPRMLRIVVEPGNQPGVPRVEVTPEDMATRFKSAATGE